MKKFKNKQEYIDYLKEIFPLDILKMPINKVPGKYLCNPLFCDARHLILHPERKNIKLVRHM